MKAVIAIYNNTPPEFYWMVVLKSWKGFSRYNCFQLKDEIAKNNLNLVFGIDFTNKLFLQMNGPKTMVCCCFGKSNLLCMSFR